ncbi:MAG: hypothetical protein AABY22_25575 [Nanoarchaeota archaeon]
MKFSTDDFYWRWVGPDRNEVRYEQINKAIEFFNGLTEEQRRFINLYAESRELEGEINDGRYDE